MTAKALRGHWPLLVAECTYGLLMLAVLRASLRHTGGHLIYPLDDSYIHMAIAKNLALHQTWGVTSYHFASASSSPLWTALLAATYLVLGVNDFSPLGLNLILGLLTVFASYQFLVRRMRRPLAIAIVLLTAVLVTPLVPLSLLGMEHVLHAFLSLCFLSVAADVVSGGERPSRRATWLLVLAALVASARFEGLFLVCATCLVLLLRKRAGYAICLGAAGFLPVIAYGTWSLLEGWYFLPNSILFKGNFPQLSAQGMIGFLTPIRDLADNSHMVVLTVAAAYLIWRLRGHREQRSAIGLALWMFFLADLLHLAFARLGHLFRYEAYLMLLGILVIGAAAFEPILEALALRPTRKFVTARLAAGLGLLVLSSPLALRAVLSLRSAPLACQDTYFQQYQMGRFLRTYYQGGAVAVNDIGAVNYLADLDALDIWGLASMDTARLKHANRLDSRELARVARAHGIRIAVVYDKWLDRIGGPPPGWRKVGEWTAPGWVVLGELTVSFYAVGRGEEAALRDHLKTFAPSLPIDVLQTSADAHL